MSGRYGKINASATNNSASSAVAHNRIQKPTRGVTEYVGGSAVIGVASGAPGVGSDGTEGGGTVPSGGGVGGVAFIGGDTAGFLLRNIAITAAPNAIVVVTP